MILTEKIEIKVIPRFLKYYREKIDEKLKVGDKVELSPLDLPENSKKNVNVKCDVCGKEKLVSIISYRRNINKYNIYCCSQKCAYNVKNIKTNLNKYGQISYTKTDEYKEKSKKTKLERYGDENYTNEEKRNRTNLERYGDENYMNTKDFKEKSEKTMLRKYGVKHTHESSIIKNKIIKTNNNKYNVNFPLENHNIYDKSLMTREQLYNDKFYNNRKKYKETCFKRYNVDNPMKNEEIRKKLINNLYEKYGVYYPSQLPYFYEKMLKTGFKIERYKDTNLYYQGTYEKDFLDKYYNIFDIEKGPIIEYNFEGKRHFYYSDFYIKSLNLIIEIKSSKWFYEHENKNITKKRACQKLGYNYLLILDKDYFVFEEMIKPFRYNKNHCWQYDIKLNNLQNDLKRLNIDSKKLSINDFKFEFVDKNDKRTKDIIDFVRKYEWLGKMPNRPTHRFIATYKGILAGVVVMSVPNSFSNILGEDKKNLEKLISRGASASWTPKNLASSLIMFSIKWMVKNTKFRIFTAYSDTEAKEIGTIYQACNFRYLGNNFGSSTLYFDPEKPHLGWTTGRNYSKLNYYKTFLKEKGIKWDDNWNKKTKILWDNIPEKIKNMMVEHTKEKLFNCIKRKPPKKHKYVYILGGNKKETKYLNCLFEKLNSKIVNLPYPKR